MAEPNEALRRCFSRRGILRSLLVAIIVGTALNVINQGDAIFSGQQPVWWKIALTYFVPFAVASYGSYAAFRNGYG